MQVEQDMTPEEAKASLGLATRLGEQMLMSEVPQPEIESMEEPVIEEPEPVEEARQVDVDSKIDEKLEILRNEMKETVALEIKGIKEMIEQALNEQD